MPKKKGADQKEKKEVYFYVAEDVYDKVVEVSEKEDISVTEIVNNALRQYLNIPKPKNKRTNRKGSQNDRQPSVY